MTTTATTPSTRIFAAATAWPGVELTGPAASAARWPLLMLGSC